MDYKIEHFKKHIDKRGQLVVFLGRSNLPLKLQKFGQIYFVTFDKPSVIRGNHYHKKWREWFGVVSGKLETRLKDLKTGKSKRLILDGNSNQYIRLMIGPGIAHGFRNITNHASLLNYSDREWSSVDTFPYNLF